MLTERNPGARPSTLYELLFNPSLASLLHAPLLSCVQVNTTIAAAASVLSMGVLMKCIYKKFDSAHVSWVEGVVEVEQAFFDLPNPCVLFGGRASPLMGGGVGAIALDGTVLSWYRLPGMLVVVVLLVMVV